MMVWQQEVLHQELEGVLVQQGVVKVHPGLEVEMEVLQVKAKACPVLEGVACPALEGVANPAQGGFQYSFSCLCVDPCGSPLNRWMRVES
jgi:hypothetical protein